MSEALRSVTVPSGASPLSAPDGTRATADVTATDRATAADDRADLHLSRTALVSDTERQALCSAGEVLSASQRSLGQALDLLARAQATLGADPQRSQPTTVRDVYESGDRIMRLGQLTTAQGVHPLRESGTLHYPDATVSTFNLLGDEQDALVGTAPFLPATPIDQALDGLAAGRQRVLAAQESLAGEQEALDQAHLRLAERGTEGAVQDLEGAHAQLAALDLSGQDIAAVHAAIEPLSTINLLVG